MTQDIEGGTSNNALVTTTPLDDWAATMDEARAFADVHRMGWSELREAVVAYRVSQNPARFARCGVNPADVDDMVYAVVKSGDLADACRALLRRDALRSVIVQDQFPLPELVESHADSPALVGSFTGQALGS